MTFGQGVRLLYRDYAMFSMWLFSKSDKLLFFPREILEENDSYRYDLTSKAYLFMKRLHTDYKTFMSMDAEDRERIFRMEMDLIIKENQDAEKHKEK